MNPPQQSGTGTPRTDNFTRERWLAFRVVNEIQRGNLNLESSPAVEIWNTVEAEIKRWMIEHGITADLKTGERDDLAAQLQAKEQELAEASATIRQFDIRHLADDSIIGDLEDQLAARDATIAGLRDENERLRGIATEADRQRDIYEKHWRVAAQVPPPKPDAPCDECDPSFTCWQNRKDCRKPDAGQARTDAP